MSWSYYGAAHRYDIHGDPHLERECADLMARLREELAEDELRRRWTESADRCAFITLLEILVDGDRTDDLRALADAGDDRALVTLMQMFAAQEREDELRREALDRNAAGWIVDYLVSRDRLTEALALFDSWDEERPDDAARLHGKRLDILLRAGQWEKVQHLAAGGDRGAQRRLKRRDSHGPTP